MYSLEELKAHSWLNKDVRFRPDTDLGIIARRIEERLTLSIPPNIGEEDLNNLVIDALENYFNNTPEGEADLSRLKDYGLAMADTFQTAFEKLSGPVADTVSTLTEDVIATVDSMMSKIVGFYNLEGEMKPVQPSYVMLKALPMAKELGEHLGSFSKKYNLNIDQVNLGNFRFLVDKVLTTEEPEISEESITRLIDELKEQCTKVQPEFSDAQKFITALLHPQAYHMLTRDMFNNGIRSGKVDEATIMAALGYIDAYPKFKKCVANFSFNVMDNAQEVIDRNLTKLEDAYLMAACIIELAREKHKLSLIIGCSMINADQFAAFEEKGGTLADITNYIRLHHNKNEQDILYHRVGRGDISPVGIPTKEVLISIPSDREQISTLMTEVNTQLLATKQRCTREAAESVLKNFVKETLETPESIPDQMDRTVFQRHAVDQIKRAVESLARNDQSNVEDAIYSFYLGTFWKNSLVSTIYYRMGAEVISKLSSTEAAGENVFNTIHATVMSDLLSNYLSQVFLVRCK